MARRSRISDAILHLMGQGGRHAWTLEDLQAGLAEDGAAPDFSTVFRAAEKLATEGGVCKLLLDDGRARFELAAAHHDHLHCTRCGALVPVSCVFDEAAFAAVEAEAGVVITEHRVVFSGLCAGCRAAAVEAGQGA
jgi:Fur family ferric uptake transcriptional regulator